MSDLTTFRDHCRRMQTAQHKPECPSQRPAPILYGEGTATVTITACEGCNPQRDRDLFARLADELDAYLHRDEAVDMFGGVGMEPEGERL